MPESKSGALPLGDSPSKPVTISFCDEITQGMALQYTCVNEPRAGAESAVRVVRFRGAIVDALQRLPGLALADAGGAPCNLRRREAAIKDTKDRRAGGCHPRLRQRLASCLARLDILERVDRRADC